MVDKMQKQFQLGGDGSSSMLFNAIENSYKYQIRMRNVYEISRNGKAYIIKW